MGECHLLLKPARGGRRCSHWFLDQEMRSLGSLCDTLLPSLKVEGDEEAVRKFYGLSASDSGNPEEVAEKIERRGQISVVFLVRMLLLLLATRLGTLLLCGSFSFRRTWPYINVFSDIDEQKREKIVQKWLKNRWFILPRLAVLFIKIICLFNFFTREDEKGENISLNAIGYKVDEQHSSLRKERPLDIGVVQASLLKESTFPLELTRKGFEVLEDDDAYNIACDAVVVGSGCGGGVAAAVLATAGHSVIVVEKGNYFAHGDFSSLEGPSADQLYESGGVLSSNDGKFFILAGSAVGGGSLINWSACIDPPSSVLQEWAEDKKLSFFTSSEYHEAVRVVNERLGVTKTCVNESFQNRVLRSGCEVLGLNVNFVPRNSSEEHACGLCMYGCPKGEKRGTDTTWLVDAVDHGAVVLTGCKAEKLMLKEVNTYGRRRLKCSGVVVKILNKNNRKKLRIHSKVTVAACGSLRTPALLLSSGLRNINIGRNLHLHPVLMAWGHFPESNPNIEGNSYEGGIITSVHKIYEQGNSLAAIIETPGIGPGSLSALWPWKSGRDFKDTMMKYRRIAHLIVIVRDKSSGNVTKPRSIGYNLGKEDKENLTAGLRRALRILIAAGAVEVGTHINGDTSLVCEGISSESIEKFLESVFAPEGPLSMAEKWGIYCSAHQMGSCRMGINESEGAVDANGQSWEAGGLFVCDGSVLPTAVGVNPMITIQSTSYYIAKKMVDYLTAN